LELVGRAMDDTQVLEAMEKKKRWPIFMLEWIRDTILKREVVIHSDKMFQGKLRICATNLCNRYTFEVFNGTNDMECHDCSFSNLMKGDDEP
jgi:hypothetical protein